MKYWMLALWMVVASCKVHEEPVYEAPTQVACPQCPEVKCQDSTALFTSYQQILDAKQKEIEELKRENESLKEDADAAKHDAENWEDDYIRERDRRPSDCDSQSF